MVLEKLHIRGFGCLRTTVKFSPDRLNLIVADNEMGKSTLVSAILAAFYGIDDLSGGAEDEYRDKRPKLHHVKPWTEPQEFGVTVDFKTGDGYWRIERDFNNGGVTVIELDQKEDRTADFLGDDENFYIGESLLGLTADNFIKSFYLRQEEILAIKDAAGLTNHIQRIASIGTDGNTAENAIARLEHSITNYPTTHSIEGIELNEAIKELKSEKESLLEEIAGLKKRKNNLEPMARRLTDIDIDLEKLQFEKWKYSRQAIMVEINELQDFIENQDRLRLELKNLEKFNENKGEFDTFPADESEELYRLSTRISDLESTGKQINETLRDKVNPPYEKARAKVVEYKDYIELAKGNFAELEALTSLYNDRRERLERASNEVELHRDELEQKGVSRENFDKLRKIFAGLAPDERKFLEEYSSQFANENSKLEELQKRIEWIEGERAAIVENKYRVVSRARLFFLISAVFVIAGGVMILATDGAWLGQVLAGIGILAAAVGAVTRSTGGSSESYRLQMIDEEIEESEAASDKARKKLDRLNEEMTNLAVKLGFSDRDKLLSVYANFDRVFEITEPLIIAERDYKRAEKDEIEVRKKIEPYLAKAENALDSDLSIAENAKKLLALYKEIKSATEELQIAQERKNEYEARLRRTDQELKSNRKRCREILKKAKIGDSLSIAESAKQFSRKLERFRQYRTTVQENLPRLKREIVSEENLNAKKRRLQQLIEKSKTWAEMPELKETLEQTKEYYFDKIEQLSKKTDDLNGEKQRIQRKIAGIFDNFQIQFPRIHKRIHELNEEIRKSEHFKFEIETAIRILKRVTGSAYSTWAKALNEYAEKFLMRLNARYADLRFAKDLTFTVRDTTHDRVFSSHEIDGVFSKGARDEIFLAARLGISSFLSKKQKGRLPVILDEPLAAADDDKFVSGMKFFMEFLTRQNQVFILSCHEERHRWLTKHLTSNLRDNIYRIDLA